MPIVPLPILPLPGLVRALVSEPHWPNTAVFVHVSSAGALSFDPAGSELEVSGRRFSPSHVVVWRGYGARGPAEEQVVRDANGRFPTTPLEPGGSFVLHFPCPRRHGERFAVRIAGLGRDGRELSPITVRFVPDTAWLYWHL